MEKNKVYSTTHYTDFCFRSNRDVTNKTGRKNIEDIKDSMRKFGWLCEPICVSEIPESDPNSKDHRFYIESGQHRFISAMEIGKPVKFIVIDPLTVEQLYYINDKHRKWNLSDSVDTFVCMGDSSYVVLKQLTEKYDVTIDKALMALGTATGEGRKKKMSEGNLVINEQMLWRAENVLKFIMKVRERKDVIKHSYNKYENALIQLSKSQIIDEERMLKQIDKYGSKLDECSTMLKAVENLEMIYNFKARGNVTALLFPYKRSLKGKL